MFRTQSPLLMGDGLDIRLDDDSLLNYVTAPTDASVGWKLDSDGYVYTYDDYTGSWAQQYRWMVSGTNADFEVYATNGGPNTPSGTFNTWLATTGDNSWTLTETGPSGAKTATITIQIRRKVSTVVFSDQASVALDIEVEVA